MNDDICKANNDHEGIENDEDEHSENARILRATRGFHKSEPIKNSFIKNNDVINL